MDSEYYLPPDAGNDHQLGHVVEPPRSPGNYLAPTNAEYLAPSDTEYMAPSEASYHGYQESHIDDRPAMRIRPGKELFQNHLRSYEVKYHQMSSYDINDLGTSFDKNHHLQKVEIQSHNQLIR